MHNSDNDTMSPETNTKKQDFRLPDEVKAQMTKCLPDLFSGRYESVLYVGANYLRQHFLEDFAESYDKVTILEIFEKNVKYLKKKYDKSGIRIMHGDVRNTPKMLSGKFDVIFFYHGPEHLAKPEVKPVLKSLEKMTEKILILGTPFGHYEQGAVYGNTHETHLWDTYPMDFEEIGFRTNTLGIRDHPHSNMIIWKRF